MNFVYANWTFALAGIAVLLLLPAALWFGRRQRRARLQRLLAAPPIQQRLCASLHTGKRCLRHSLFLAAAVLLAMTAARPWWGTRTVPQPERTRDVLVLLDCSRSMLAADIAPSRLQHGKWWIRELVNRFPGDRFGLVAFAGHAFLECPLTSDRNTFFLFLNDITNETIPAAGTNIEVALNMALEAFGDSAGKHRAVVIVSDGEQLQGDMLAALPAYQRAQIPIIGVGIGNADQDTMIQLADNQFMRDRNNNLVRTRLVETGLQQLSAATDGVYVRSSSTRPNLEAVQRRLALLLPQQGEQQSRQEPVERYQIFLTLAMALLILRLFISERRRFAGVASSGAMLLLLLFCSIGTGFGANAAEPASADDSYRQLLENEAAELAQRLETAPAKQLPRLRFQYGYTLQQIGEVEKAERVYQQLVTDAATPPDVRAAAYTNLGVLRHQHARQKLHDAPEQALQSLTAAEHMYKETMLQDLQSRQSRRNQELLLRDRQYAQQIIELRQQLQDLAQQAQEKTQEALAQQQQADAAGRGSGAEQQQQQAAQSTAAAAEAIDALKQAQQQLGQQQQAQRSAQAAQEVDAAQQQQGDGRSNAAEHLQNALDLLNGAAEPQQQADDGDESDPDQQPQSQQDAQSDQQQDQPPQQSPEQGQKPGSAAEQSSAEAGEDDGNAESEPTAQLDEQQVRMVLQKMQNQESDLRQQLKRQQMQHLLREPDKNW